MTEAWEIGLIYADETGYDTNHVAYVVGQVTASKRRIDPLSWVALLASERAGWWGDCQRAVFHKDILA